MKIKVMAISQLPVREVCAWDKLRPALENVNGKAEAHTADCHDVVRAAIDAEKNLDSLKLLKKHRKGARFVFVSGKPVTNAYSKKTWWRAATRVELVRSGTADTWHAVSITRTEIDSRGGSYTTYLTPEQADIAMARFRQQFEVIPQPMGQAAA